MADTQKIFAQIVGVVLILVGLLGFFNDPVIGMFEVNGLHNVVHLATGAVGLFMAAKGMSKMFNKWFGVVYLLVAVLGFMGVLGFLEANAADNWLHLLLGVVSLGVAYGVKEA